MCSRPHPIMGDTMLQEAEVISTALLHLRIGLFSDANVGLGACLHQLPVNCNNVPERAAFYTVQSGADKLPTRPIAISDYKNTDLSKARMESFGYSTRSMKKKV